MSYDTNQTQSKRWIPHVDLVCLKKFIKIFLLLILKFELKK